MKPLHFIQIDKENLEHILIHKAKRMYLTADPVTGAPFWKAMGFELLGEISPENRQKIFEKEVCNLPSLGSFEVKNLEQSTFLSRCASVYNRQVLILKDNEFIRADCHPKLKDKILVGDYVECEKQGNQTYITKIHERKNVIKRIKNGSVQKLSSNVDIAFIVTSANNDFNIARLERYFIVAKESCARICFVLSKCDLTENSMEFEDIIRYNFSCCDIVKTSIFKNTKLDIELYKYWNEYETAIFLGSSGVGKSSLINLMLGNDTVRTNNIREKDDKGRHTTTVRQMFLLDNNRIIIDTPGLRRVGIKSDSDSIEELFSDIVELQTKCKFSDCSHTNEPKCAILNAIHAGDLDYERYVRYLRLKGKQEIARRLASGKEYQRKDAIKDLKKKMRRC